MVPADPAVPIYHFRITGNTCSAAGSSGYENHMKRSVGLIVLGIIALVAVAYFVIALVIL